MARAVGQSGVPLLGDDGQDLEAPKQLCSTWRGWYHHPSLTWSVGLICGFAVCKAYESVLFGSRAPANPLYPATAGGNVLAVAAVAVQHPSVHSARDVADGFNLAGPWSFPPSQQGGAPTWEEFKQMFRPWVDMGKVPDEGISLNAAASGNTGDGTTGFSYQFVHPWDSLQVGLHGWFHGEFHAWNNAFTGNQFVPFVEVGGKDLLALKPDNHFVSYAAYMLSDWQRPFAGLVPKHFNSPSVGVNGEPLTVRKLTVRVHDLDFYQIDPVTKKLTFNWCLVDLVGILQQGGHDLKLPKSGLDDNLEADYLPPSVMDGSPAPRRFGPQSLCDGRAKRARLAVHQAIAEDFGPSGPASGQAQMWAEGMTWYGPVGIGTAHNRSVFVGHFLAPFRAAFANTSLDYDVLACEGNYCAAHLRVHGLHVGEWLGVRPRTPGSPQRVSVRMGLHFRVRDPRECGAAGSGLGEHLDSCAVIEEGWSQIDLLSTLMQMGRDVISELREQQEREGFRLEDYV